MVSLHLACTRLLGGEAKDDADSVEDDADSVEVGAGDLGRVLNPAGLIRGRGHVGVGGWISAASLVALL